MPPINYLNIIQENERRLAILHEPYNPLSGLGSPVPRFRFKINAKSTLWLPETMKNTEIISKFIGFKHLAEGCRKAFGRGYEEHVGKILSEINIVRIEHDFEFWTYSCARIQDKLTKEIIPFKLNKPQRKLLQSLETSRLAGEPIRKILLKARQWGGSTLVQLYMDWIQLFHRTRWHSAIVADVEEQARNIRGMYKTVADYHPKEVFEIILRPYQGSSKNKEIAGRDCAVAIGSMQQPDNLRSFDFAMAHFSELGLWKTTKGKQPKDLVQAIRSTIPNVHLSMVVMESTAKGVGNFFHQEWLDAVNQVSGYDPIFVAWFEIEMYQQKLPKTGYINFIDRMSAYHWYLWESGATLEGVNWYKNHKKNENMDDWRMQSEFPTTATEAFASTGRRAFAPLYVRQARVYNRKPDFIGDFEGASQAGEQALNNIKFVDNSQGNCFVWEMPDKTRNIKNRYVVPVDIGGRTHVADYSIIRVIDRAPMLEGGVPEAILTWKGHLDQDLVIWKAAQIAKIYSNALLVPESNSLRRKTDESEGDHILTIMDEIKPFYDNLYSRTDPEKVREGVPVKYGFHTNMKTKVALIDNVNKQLREEGYIEYDSRVCDEYDVYEMKPDGTYGAVEGQHDDMVMCTAIGIKVSDQMDSPVEIVKRDAPMMNKKLGVADF